MLIIRKRRRTHAEDRVLALWLAGSAGMLNAIALAAFGVFPSNMSGNTATLGEEIAHSHSQNLLLLGKLILAFILGALIARVCILAGLHRRVRTVHCYVLAVEGVIMMVLGAAMMFLTPDIKLTLLPLMAFMMGAHNATATQLSGGRVRATHITGTLTDLGIVLGALLYGSTNHIGDRSIFLTYLVTLISFLVGAILGLILFQNIGYFAIETVGLLLVLPALTAAVYFAYKVRRHPC